MTRSVTPNKDSMQKPRLTRAGFANPGSGRGASYDLHALRVAGPFDAVRFSDTASLQETPDQITVQ